MHFAPFCLSSWCPDRVFVDAQYPLLDPKIPLFDGCFALFSHVFHGSRRLCLYYCGVFLCLSPRVLQHFALRFAPFYLAFSTKTHCILHQNALHLAAYCTAFCTILHYISLQIVPKQVQMAVACNKYSFCRTNKLTPFSIKTNPRENRFFGARRAVGGEKGQP